MTQKRNAGLRGCACRGMVAVAVFALAACVLAGCSEDSQPIPVGWQKINESGFGDSSNAYAWSMAGFNGSLYVGTMSMENALAGVLYMLAVYVPDMSKGTEVWRFNPSGQWSRVVTAGFDGDRANFGTRKLIVFEGNLYAGTVNHGTGLEVWRTGDGTVWNQVGRDGMGDRDNLSTRAMHIHNGQLYLGTENRETGGQLWRSPDGENWELVAKNGLGNRRNFSVSAMATFLGDLYVGTWNGFQGAEVWRSSDGLNFQRVVAGGNGNRWTEGVMCLTPFGDSLFAPTVGFPLGGELLATKDGVSWQTVGEPGFGNPLNVYLWSMQEFRGWLYLGTFKGGGENGPFKTGFDLYRSRDGYSWETISQDGLGDQLNYGVRTMAVMGEALYLGTAEAFSAGCEVLRTNGVGVHIPPER